MTNHVHLILVPSTKESLHHVLKPLHMRYAQRFNRIKQSSGHLWQGRYFSAPLDESYLWTAIRYIEQNPVRAKMVKKAEDYPWSSAAAHCELNTKNLLSKKQIWQDLFKQITDWKSWLEAGNYSQQIMTLRRHTYKNFPCGSEVFITQLEKITGRSFYFRPQGRPKKTST